MQLHSFFPSLDLLRKPEILALPLSPAPAAGSILYFGAGEETDDTGEKRCYLYYCTEAEPRSIRRADVTAQQRYMEALDDERIDTENAIDAADLKVLLLEASLLFDGLCYAEGRFPLLDFHPAACPRVLHALCTCTDMEGEMLSLFDGAPFLRRLCFRQILYFFKRYVKASPLYRAAEERADTDRAFVSSFCSAFTEYYEKYGTGRHMAMEITGRSNPALDDFIDQLMYDADRL